MSATRSGALSAILALLLAGCADTPPSTSLGDDANAGMGNTPAGGAEPGAGAAPATAGAGENTEAGGAGAAHPAGGAPQAAGGQGDQAGAVGAEGGEPADVTTTYATQLESFEPGPGAGYNQDLLPNVVLGPPQGKGLQAGSLDVVSLGAGGSIVLSFGEAEIVDGEGPDLIVFENAFWPGGAASQVFAELGEVSLSQDGETWYTFPCDEVGDGQGRFAGCAGVTPTLVYDAATLAPLDPAQSGGDAFDLADLGLASARYVRIVDLETLPPASNTTGFDLDAVGIIHSR